MAWVKFSEPFDFNPLPRMTIAYTPGPNAVCVRRICADLAIAAGKAEEASPPPRTEDPAAAAEG
jgi:hypothetical protein